MNGQLINCTSESDRKQEQHTHNVSHPLYPHWMGTLEFLEPLLTGIPQIQAVTSIISHVRHVCPCCVNSASIVNSVWFMVSNWETSVVSTVNRKWGQLLPGYMDGNSDHDSGLTTQWTACHCWNIIFRPFILLKSTLHVWNSWKPLKAYFCLCHWTTGANVNVAFWYQHIRVSQKKSFLLCSDIWSW